MKTRFPFGLVLALLLMAIGTTALHAIWIDDGVNVCTAPGDQSGANQTTDGSGGVIVAWLDNRTTDPGIYAQRVGATGGVEWDPQGELLYTPVVGSNPQVPNLTSDGSGGAIVVWHDYRGLTDIYAQRVDDSGTAQWTATGLPICTAGGYQWWPAAVPDGAGGAIIVWEDSRGVDKDIYAQRVNASGSVLWTTDGVPVCTATGSQEGVKIISDGAGGAIIAWQDLRSGDSDIYAQRINANGNVLWLLNGKPFCNLAGYQGIGQLAPDNGAGGALICWTDQRAGNNDIYVQRVQANGSAVWTANGVPACSAPSYQSTAAVTTDGAGGAIVAWEDARLGSFAIFAQRIGATGGPVWTANGVQATPVYSGAQILAKLVSDEVGGAIMTWHLANFGGNVDAQRVDAWGTMLWGTSGVKVCGAPTGNQTVMISPDGAGGAIMSWSDERSVDRDLRVQQINPDGCTGYLPADIQTVADVSDDQGGLVRVTFDRSSGDRPEVFESPIASYTIWQRIDDLSTASAVVREGRTVGPGDMGLLSGPGAVAGVKTPISADLPLVEWDGRLFHLSSASWTQCKSFPPGTWEAVLSLGATRQDSYVGRVSTVRDSSDTGIPYSAYVVTTHTLSAAWYIGAADSGYSVDNIPPGAPTGMLAAYNTGSGNQLQWDPSSDDDFQYYRVYRGMDPVFVPDVSTLVDLSSVPAWSDPDYDGWQVYYKVTAVDQAGNESDPGSPGTTSAAGDALPSRAALYPNTPNPFNPSTVISYDVPGDGSDVSLVVYDVSGRLVRKLVAGTQTAGRHSAQWDGSDDTGLDVASGVYFYRLTMTGFAETRKMVLLK